MTDSIQILGLYTHVTDSRKRQTELALHIQQKLNHIHESGGVLYPHSRQDSHEIL